MAAEWIVRKSCTKDHLELPKSNADARLYKGMENRKRYRLCFRCRTRTPLKKGEPCHDQSWPIRSTRCRLAAARRPCLHRPAHRLAAAELSAADFRFDGPLGSSGTTIEKVSANHFRVTPGRGAEKLQWSNMLQFTIEPPRQGQSAATSTPAGTGSRRTSWAFASSAVGPTTCRTGRPIQATMSVGLPTLLFPEFTEDRVYFGGEVPMSYEQHEAMIHRWARHPHASSTVIGHSPEGRKIYRLTVTDPDSPYPVEKRWVHHVVNQHCYEYNAQWRIAGMIDSSPATARGMPQAAHRSLRRDDQCRRGPATASAG